MRDRLSPPHSVRTLLSPAEGLEPSHELFSESPIEALDWLTELGQIAKESIEPVMAAETGETAPEEVQAVELPAAAPTTEAPPAPVTTQPASEPVNEESRLVEALLEYHRLRNPALGARTAPRPAKGTEFARTDASAEPKNHFSPLEIPVVKNVAAKTPASGVRSTRPTQTILRPKPRS